MHPGTKVEIVDYRQGGGAVVEGIKAALPASGALLLHAYDAVSDHGSFIQLGNVLASGGKITLVLPSKQYDAIPAHVVQTITSVGAVHDDTKDFGFVWFRLFARGLKEGWFKPQPQEVVPGGFGELEGWEAKCGQVCLQDCRHGGSLRIIRDKFDSPISRILLPQIKILNSTETAFSTTARSEAEGPMVQLGRKCGSYGQCPLY